MVDGEETGEGVGDCCSALDALDLGGGVGLGVEQKCPDSARSSS